MSPATKIMVVDDEEMVRILIQKALREAGYETISAASGEEALQKLSQPPEERPALVLLDIMMPGMSGIEVLKAMRERFDLPVIMVSGQHDVNTMSETLNLGADDFLKKPFRTAELIGRVKAKLRRAT